MKNLPCLLLLSLAACGASASDRAPLEASGRADMPDLAVHSVASVEVQGPGAIVVQASVTFEAGDVAAGQVGTPVWGIGADSDRFSTPERAASWTSGAISGFSGAFSIELSPGVHTVRLLVEGSGVNPGLTAAGDIVVE